MPYSSASIIRQAWERSGLTQRDFSSRLGVSRSSLQRYMRGEFKSAAKAITTEARIIAYSERHSKDAAERFAYKMRERREGRSVRVKGREFLGQEAVKIKRLYREVNKVREGLGMKSISPKGFYGKPENLVNVLERQAAPGFLEEAQRYGREGLKVSFAIALERRGNDKMSNEVKKRLDALTDSQLDKLYDEYRSELEKVFADSDRLSMPAAEVYKTFNRLIDKVLE